MRTGWCPTWESPSCVTSLGCSRAVTPPPLRLRDQRLRRREVLGSVDVGERRSRPVEVDGFGLVPLHHGLAAPLPGPRYELTEEGAAEQKRRRGDVAVAGDEERRRAAPRRRHESLEHLPGHEHHVGEQDDRSLNVRGKPPQRRESAPRGGGLGSGVGGRGRGGPRGAGRPPPPPGAPPPPGGGGAPPGGRAAPRAAPAPPLPARPTFFCPPCAGGRPPRA